MTFLNPGGKITVERTSIKFSPVVLEPRPESIAGRRRPGRSRPAAKRSSWLSWTTDSSTITRTWPATSGPTPANPASDATGHAKETNRARRRRQRLRRRRDGLGFCFRRSRPRLLHLRRDAQGPVQPYWHSISALGIIGARGNNGLGVAGINWDVSLMLLKIGAQGIARGEKDTARPGRAAKAIRYAADNGARVVNWSGLVSDPTSEALAELKAAIEYAGTKSVLLVVGRGEFGPGRRPSRKRDLPGLLPTREHPDRGHDRFPGRARPLHGRRPRPGLEFRPAQRRHRRPRQNFTTFLKNGRGTYTLSAGTSNSGPVVTGIAALTLSVRPDLSATALKSFEWTPRPACPRSRARSPAGAWSTPILLYKRRPYGKVVKRLQFKARELPGFCAKFGAAAEFGDAILNSLELGFVSPNSNHGSSFSRPPPLISSSFFGRLSD